MDEFSGELYDLTLWVRPKTAELEQKIRKAEKQRNMRVPNISGDKPCTRAYTATRFADSESDAIIQAAEEFSKNYSKYLILMQISVKEI